MLILIKFGLFKTRNKVSLYYFVMPGDAVFYITGTARIKISDFSN